MEKLIGAADFESLVAEQLRESGRSLKGYTVTRREVLAGPGGEYEIDVVARFEALGADFVVLVECKALRRPVEREHILVLQSKLSELSAQKGMVYSTAGYQRGAIEYAKANSISLREVRSGTSSIITKGVGTPQGAPPWVKIPEWSLIAITLMDSGAIQHELIQGSDPDLG